MTLTKASERLLDAFPAPSSLISREFLRERLVVIEREAIREWVDSAAVWDKLVDASENNPGWIVDALRALAEQ